LIPDFNQQWIEQLTFNSDYSSPISETMFTGAAPGQTNKLAQGPAGGIYEGKIYQLTFSGVLTEIAPQLC
jgi:hypothetical protein